MRIFRFVLPAILLSTAASLQAQPKLPRGLQPKNKEAAPIINPEAQTGDLLSTFSGMI